MTLRSYQETLDYLYTKLPMFSRVGAAAMKPGLDNIIRLCQGIGNPQEKFKSIHIAGTNGKGSTSHVLAAIFQQNGYKTGLYTSPHLIDFRERIKIDGREVSKSFVVEFVGRSQQLIQEIKPSFFEITVAMAFAAFAETNVDIAIIETGLGGRLDSTNIITPELSIITNISLDHTDILGDTRDKIAAEKAGIIKKAVPVVVGEKDNETRKVFERAATTEYALLVFVEDVWEVHKVGREGNNQTFKAKALPDGRAEVLSLDLSGDYQTQNLRTVLTAYSMLQQNGWAFEQGVLKEALQNVIGLTGLHGRYERLSESPLIVADVAHNPAGLGMVLAQWGKEKVAKAHIVVGFVRDKDVASALALFPKDAQYYFTNASIPRALPAGELAEQAANAGLEGNSYDTVKDAITAMQLAVGEGDGVLITGSFFIVGEAIECLNQMKQL